MTEAGTPDTPRSPAWKRAWSTSWRGDRRALCTLLALPVVAFVVPALAGHPVIAGDNQIQNYPLRVLSGQVLGSGHLPLWDPWIWSGSPLLGGLNAGSLYPGTWLYAVLPGIAAWTVNLVATYWIAVTGLYVLSRRYGMLPLSAAIGAAAFGFAGAMTAQMVHLGVVQGVAWIPWMVLAELELAELYLPGSAVAGRRTRRGPSSLPGWRLGAPWVLLLGTCGGLVFLAGEPRSMADAAWVCAACPLWWLLRRRRHFEPYAARRIAFVVSVATGAALSLAVGAVQLLPGTDFLSTTQRSTASLSFFGFGSFSPRWIGLLAVPDLFGGDGILHQPQYFSSYNLPEVTGYVGLLALVAAFSLAARSFGHSRSVHARAWSTWIVVGVVGLFLSFGTDTFLGGPLSHIPFYGGLRDQSRNLSIVDIALGLLLAFWVDSKLRETVPRSTATGVGSVGSGRFDVAWADLVGLVPAAIAALLCIGLIAVPSRLESAFGMSSSAAGSARGLTPWAILQLAVALAVVCLVVCWRRVSPTRAHRALVTVFVCDLLLFSVSCSTGFVAGRGVPLVPVASDAARLGNGRFAIYDPAVVKLPGLIEVGETDLNALTRHPSVQGYGSVVSETYDAATGTHLDGTLSPCALEAGAFSPLGLTTLLALPGSVAPRAGGRGPRGATCGVRWPASSSTERRWLLEGPTTVDHVDLDVPASLGLEPAVLGTLRVGIVDPSGVVEFPAAATLSVDGSGLDVGFAHAVSATGIVAAGAGAGQIGDSTVVSGPGVRVELDGPLQDGLDRGDWHYAGKLDGFVVYRRDVAARTVWVEGDPPSARAERLEFDDQTGGETDTVASASAFVVARSEAYSPGWHVEATNLTDGRTQSLRVGALGLVQSVHLRAGRYRLVWSYWPPGLSVGLAASAAGSVLVLLGAIACWRWRRTTPLTG